MREKADTNVSGIIIVTIMMTIITKANSELLRELNKSMSEILARNCYSIHVHSFSLLSPWEGGPC